MPCKIPALILALVLNSAWAVSAARAGEAVFDSPAFWAERQADFGARMAWEEGAKWYYDDSSAVSWHDGSIFGFSRQDVPDQDDPSVRSRVALGTAQRAEMRAIRVAGLFAFNHLDCSAKANFPNLAADRGACSSVEILGKMTGDFQGVGFSVVKLASDPICACRKALDGAEVNTDCNIFFGPIARIELGDLLRGGRRPEMIEFFRAHQRKNIFGPEQFFMVMEALLGEGRDADALVLADVAGKRFGGILNSDQWELLGEYYLRLGRDEPAAESFRMASGTFYAEKRYNFEETCFNR